MDHSPMFPRRYLGSTGLSCHPLGFGCYRVTRGNLEHANALRAYLDLGANLIDTSANYGDGLSEDLVGDILHHYPRDRIVVVTKGGYIQGRNMALAQKHDFPEVVRYGEGLWHCIHPQFLQTQIERSLERLQLHKVDVYLLHNPEYFLTDRGHRGGLTRADYEEFYRRIREAFRFLEAQVQRGTIAWYGISSNNFGLPASDPAMTSVSRCLREAQSLSNGHHFRVVQLPMNLFEPGGALNGTEEGRTVLRYCEEEGIGVLVNRPLNAFSRNRLIRLADHLKPGESAPDAETLRRLLKPVREYEQRLECEMRATLLEGGGVAALLEHLAPQLESSAHWERAAGPYVLRPLQHWLQSMQGRFAEDSRWQAWIEEFPGMMNRLLEDYQRYLSAKEQHSSDEVRARLFEAGYPGSEASLSRLALNVLIHLKGVSCILTGMRRVDYVKDAMGVLELPEVDSLRILRNLQPS